MPRRLRIRDQTKPNGRSAPIAIAARMTSGAEPNTAWLCGSVETDAKGFVCADTLATSKPGVFAIGDVRAGSTKRVAAAVGEGAQVVAAIHGYLAKRAEKYG